PVAGGDRAHLRRGGAGAGARDRAQAAVRSAPGSARPQRSRVRARDRALAKKAVRLFAPGDPGAQHGRQAPGAAAGEAGRSRRARVHRRARGAALPRRAVAARIAGSASRPGYITPSPRKKNGYVSSTDGVCSPLKRGNSAAFLTAFCTHCPVSVLSSGGCTVTDCTLPLRAITTRTISVPENCSSDW